MSELPTSIGVLNLHPIQVINSSSTLISAYENPKPLGLMDRVSVWDYFFKTLVRKTYKSGILSLVNRPNFRLIPHSARNLCCEIRASIKRSPTTGNPELQNLLTDLGEIGFDKPELQIEFVINISLANNNYQDPENEYLIEIFYAKKDSPVQDLRRISVPFAEPESAMSHNDLFYESSKEALLALEAQITGIIENF